MMKRLTRMLVVLTAGAALGYVLVSPRARGLRERGSALLQRCCTWSDCSCGGRTPEAADSDAGTSDATDPDMQAKIDETRRRLREQLNETLTGAPPAGSDRPQDDTTT